MRRLVAATVLFVSVLPASSALAEEGDFKTIVTPTRRETPAFETPGQTLVVGRESLIFEMPNDVPEAMLSLPGVMVQRTNRGAATPILRGLVGPENLLLLDGVRLNTSIYRTGPNQYAALVDPLALQSVEVVLGPGSVLYGTDAMGGTINHLTLPVPREGRAVDLSLTGSSVDLGLGLRAHGELVEGPLSGWVRGGMRRFGELTAGGSTVPLSDYQQYDWGTKLRLELGREWSLTGALIGAFIDNAARIDSLGRGSVRFADNMDNLAYLRLQRRASELVRSLVFTVSLHAVSERDERRLCNTLDGGATADRAGCIAGLDSAVRALETREDSVNGLGLSAELGLSPLAWLDVDFGTEFRNEWVGSRRIDNPESRGNFSDGSTFGTADAWLWAETRLLWSDYEESDQKVRLKLDGGIRGTAVFANAPDVPGLGDVGYDFAGLVGALRASALIGRGLHFWAGYSQGFRAPNLQETTVLGDTGQTFEVPNPDLGPQTNDTIEFGLRMQSPLTSFSLVGFSSAMRDSIVREPTTFEGQSQVDGKDVVRRINANSTEYVGLEAQLEVGPFKGVTVLGSIGYVDGVQKVDGESLVPRRLPPFQGRAAVRWQSDWRRFRVETGVRFSAAQTLLNPEDERDLRICGNVDGTGFADNCQGTPGWANVYVGAAVEPIDSLTVRLRAENVLDQDYKVHGSGYPAPGRSLELGLGVRFN